MASGLILGILFMRYQKWYLAAVAAGILFGIVWNLWHNTIRNCIEKDSMATVSYTHLTLPTILRV